MSFSGSGGIWAKKSGDFEAKNFPGDQAGFDAAKVYVATSGGVIQVGPGLEFLVLGAFATNVALIQLDNVANIGLSALKVLDATDPTKAISFNIQPVSTAVTRDVQFNDWAGIAVVSSNLGVSGQFLKSNGGVIAPSFDTLSVTNALLDGVNHTDTLAGAVVRGDVLVGNSTPKWSRVALGTSGQVLQSNGTDAVWGSTPSVQHGSLGSLAPYTVADCTSSAASATVTTTTPNGFANVKVGDRIDGTFIGTGVLGFGQTVAVINSTTSIDTNTFNATGTASVTVIPDHHTQYALTQGRGSGLLTPFDATTGQIMTGNYYFRPNASGVNVVEFKSVTNPATLEGFCWRDDANNARWFIDFQNTSAGNRLLTMPFTASQELIGSNHAQTIQNKTLTEGNVLRMDETGATTNGCAFRDRTGTTKGLGFDLTGVTAGQNRVAKWPDVSPGGFVESDYLARVTGISGTAVATTNLYTVPTGKSVIVTRAVVRCTAATTPAAGPTFGIGVAAGEDDIVASSAHASFINSDTLVLVFPKDPAVVATSAQVIKLGIDLGSTNASMTLAVDLSGYLV